MASLGGSILPLDVGNKLLFGGIALFVCSAIGYSKFFKRSQRSDEKPNPIKSLVLFCYSCFLKPHRDGKGSQQEALESFYRTQASVYDVTRKTLLKGREDMLALAAAQLARRSDDGPRSKSGVHKRIWVDVSRGWLRGEASPIR